MSALSRRAAVAAFLIIGLAACSVESPAGPAEFEPQMAHAATAPNFGTKASGSELFTPGIVRDGGPGAASASISRSNFTASAELAPGSTYLPELRALSTNSSAANSDDITQARAEAYQVFTSSASQTISLNVNLSAVVLDNSSDRSFVLADVFVYGGSGFEVIESPICEDGRLGRFMFDQTYFCGSRFGWSNLFIPVGDVTLPDVLSFSVASGERFGVFAVLRANSSGGSADASQTLTLDFTDDQFITADDFSDPTPLSVDIDVKPGSDQNCLNMNGHGVIPVAILGSDAFDVTQIDLMTLSFSGLEVRMRSEKGPLCSLDDSNADGFTDLVCHFEDDLEAWLPGENEATVTGALFDGTEFAGSDEICTVPRE